MKKILATLNDRLLSTYGVIAFFLLWEMAPRLGWADAQFIPTLSRVLLAIWKLAITGELFIHIASSLQRILAGLFLAIVIAVPLGFIMGGWLPGLARFLRPLMTMLAQINAFTLFPLFIIFFGIGEGAKISIIFWSTFWPILFITLAGVQQVDPLYIKSARSMGASGFTIFFKVILPGAARSIFTGIRIGNTMAFMMLIGAEMIGADTGLGWLIHNSNVNNTIPRLYAGLVTIAMVGVGLNYSLQWLEDSLFTWGGDYHGEKEQGS